MRVGIPRALQYYQYFPAWKTFFETLGAEVVVSPPTTQVMLAEGSARVVADTCLPAKVFLGHVIWLSEKCDKVFIPAVRSVEKKVYNCSKFLGLPDMTKAVIPEMPGLLEIDIDINRGKSLLYRNIYLLGLKICNNPLKIKDAAQHAWQALLDYQDIMSREKLVPDEAICRMYPEYSEETPSPGGSGLIKGTVALIGHPYLIYDNYVNHRLIHRLEKIGNQVVTPEMVPLHEQKDAVDRVSGSTYWTYENEVAGAGGYYLENKVDGVIGIMAFGCGPDSLMMDMVRRYASARKSIPFMCLTLEEHTAEAGVVTRLEAFTDMIYRRKKSERNLCVSESLI
ncbi:MAG: hypothetical protein JW712_11675 [Dehalococcoidales bacterium]|nr:hypothetical protein [Dehalococcoidales bacterium]